MLERIFRLSERGSDVRTEVVAGAVTATCLGAALATLIMAFYSNYPFALAPGMGLNAFLVFGVIIGMKFPWQVGMAVIFIEGLIIAFIGLNQGGIILPALITMVTLGDFTQP